MVNNTIINEYKRILEAEFQIDKKNPKFPFPEAENLINSGAEIYKIAKQVLYTAKISTIPRSYIDRYGLDTNQVSYESVGAHTNLASAIADKALSYYYPDFGNPNSSFIRTIDGYSYREIMETIRIHDLPETKLGDLPDNGSIDRTSKSIAERAFMEDYNEFYPAHETVLGEKALELFYKMENSKESNSTSKLLHLSDKISAVIITLQYDRIKHSPVIHEEDKAASKRDQFAMLMCDWSEKGYHKASEMWTIDFLHIRELNKLDETGFFTALLVMITLIVNNGKWYEWREKDYRLITHR